MAKLILVLRSASNIPMCEYLYIHMNMSASVQTGRARSKVSSTSRVILSTSLQLTSRQQKIQSCEFFRLEYYAFFENFGLTAQDVS